MNANYENLVRLNEAAEKIYSEGRRARAIPGCARFSLLIQWVRLPYVGTAMPFQPF
jgi:hypothetical protein